MGQEQIISILTSFGQLCIGETLNVLGQERVLQLRLKRPNTRERKFFNLARQQDPRDYKPEFLRIHLEKPPPELFSPEQNALRSVSSEEK